MNYSGVFDSHPSRVPTDKVVDGPIFGNGDVGVVISGPPEAQRFWVSKCDFWKARAGYPNGSPRPIGWLDIAIPQLEGASYHFEQRLSDAHCLGTFAQGATTVVIDAWVSATENLLVVEISCSGEPVHITLALGVQTGHGSKVGSGSHEGVDWVTRSFSEEDLDWSSEAAISMRCMGGRRLGSREYLVGPGCPLVVVASILTNHDADGFLGATRARVAELDSAVVASLRDAHEAWWRDFWSASFIDIGDPLIEQFWYGSLYIMACCSRNKGFAPGLFGNWITTDAPAWAGDYHLNYNHQAPWWGVYSANHVDLSEPYDTPILEFLPKAREAARTGPGHRGAVYPVGVGPRGLDTTGMMFWGQKSNASFAAVNMVMRYEHTRDRDYLERIAYPFLVEVADFWEGCLNLTDGRYVVTRGAAHEQADAEYSYEGADMNPIVDLALIRMVLSSLLGASRELGRDAHRRGKWQHILDNLSAFPTMEVNGKTVFRLAEEGDTFRPRENAVNLQHIWPAGCIGLGSDSAVLQVARDTIVEKDSWSDYNAFPTVFTAAVRVGMDPGFILEKMRHQLQHHSYPNLFVFFGGGGIETCSAVVSAIDEMLLQSHQGVLRLFPVWPRDRPAKFGRLRAVGAFLVSAELADGTVQTVAIESEKGGLCTMLNPVPDSNPHVVELCGGEAVPVAVTMGSRGEFTFPTRAGGSYECAWRSRTL